MYLDINFNTKGENNMITKQEVYANGIDWLISRSNEKILENKCLKRQFENKNLWQKIKEYIKEII